MLQCLVLMGNLFVSDGQVMIAVSSMSHVARDGALLVVGAGPREDGLDISGYPAEMGVHTILADCAARASAPQPGVDIAAM